MNARGSEKLMAKNLRIRTIIENIFQIVDKVDIRVKPLCMTKYRFLR